MDIDLAVGKINQKELTIEQKWDHYELIL